MSEFNWGDMVWVRDSVDEEWREAIFIKEDKNAPEGDLNYKAFEKAFGHTTWWDYCIPHQEYQKRSSGRVTSKDIQALEQRCAGLRRRDVKQLDERISNLAERLLRLEDSGLENG